MDNIFEDSKNEGEGEAGPAENIEDREETKQNAGEEEDDQEINAEEKQNLMRQRQ